MDADCLSIDDKRIVSSKTGARFFDFSPSPVSCEVFTPPWERRTLLWTDGIDGALLVVIQIDAYIIYLSTFQNISAV
jgi:hypothetical protein